MNNSFHRCLQLVLVSLITWGSVLLQPQAALAQQRFPYAHMSLDECTVTYFLWAYDSRRDRLLLPRAIKFHANLGVGKPESACTKKVSLGVDRIDMTGTLVVEASGSSAQPFVIEGGCIGDTSPADGICDGKHLDGDGNVIPTRLDASGLPDGFPCVVRLVGGKGNYVKMKDIVITGTKPGTTPVCMDANNATMDNVQINGGENGFVIAENSTGNRILANSLVEAVNNVGIHFKNDELASLNFIEPYSVFNKETGAHVSITLPTAGPDGFIALPLDATTQVAKKFTIQAISGGMSKWIISENPVQVKLIKKQFVRTAQPHVLVQGMVVRGSGNLCTAPSFQNVEKIQVYASGDREQTGGFFNYIGRQPNTSGFGFNPTTGFFQARFPAGENDPDLVMLIPEVGGESLGRSSILISISNEQSDVECPNRAFNSAAGGVTPPDTPGTGTAKVFDGYTSVDDCRTRRGIRFSNTTAPDSNGFDSDGDGVFDNDEDLDGDCECDQNEMCWYFFDTDDDGVPDGASGNETYCDGRHPTALDILGRPMPSCIHDGAGQTLAAGACDGKDDDCDRLPRGLDSDSDNDGLKDGAEDRNFFFSRNIGPSSTQGILFRYQGVFGLTPVMDMTETDLRKRKPLTCNLLAGRDVGVRYAWHQIPCQASDLSCVTFTGNPQEVAFGQITPSSGTDVRYGVLFCRNQSLSASANFNGSRQEGNSELDMYNPDTDGDLRCDGDDDRGCNMITRGGNTLLGKNDNCPLVHDQSDNCREAIACSEEQVFYSVLPHFVEYSQGTPTGLVDVKDWQGGTVANGDGVPDVLQVNGGTRQDIEQNCPGDTDQDGIPDCVENPFAECEAGGLARPNQNNPNSWSLKYYLPDSDGDGLLDGWRGGANADVCPENYGAGRDRFSGPTANYSCDPRLVYERNIRRVLSCFLDRDNDGLRDCEEDLNKNGDYEGGQVTELITKTILDTLIESDPLDEDTDDDDLNDFFERTVHVKQTRTDRIYTNPGHHDTDGDGLLDGQEKRERVAGRAQSWNIGALQGAEECTNAFDRSGAPIVDTDPTSRDTDGDNLEDGVELIDELIVGNRFLQLIGDPAQLRQGIDSMSNPRSADSDNDGLPDDKEYNGIITYIDSNPCMRDSDADGRGRGDIDECPGCRLNPSDNCRCVTGGGGDGNSSGGDGQDSDGDGLNDSCERTLGTDSAEIDTDGDGVFDGDEDANKNCLYEPNRGESSPLIADSDGDSLNDGFEARGGTDPTNIDTDGDCIPDGPMQITNLQGQVIQSRGEDANGNGRYEIASETNPNSVDSDGEGLNDGGQQPGEDVNCDGVRNVDPNTGQFLETDPKLKDSDFDGDADYQEVCAGGLCAQANVSGAVSGPSGCSLTANGGNSQEGMVMFAGLALALGWLSMRKKAMLVKQKK